MIQGKKSTRKSPRYPRFRNFLHPEARQKPGTPRPHPLPASRQHHEGRTHNPLFTAPEARGQGVGRAPIDAVCAEAKRCAVKHVTWQTHQANTAGRLLYEK
ncbi:MAG: hypothetical protein COW59_05320 [Lysobacterales bacterium CG17_big_fil_post_rev_8_21_14_2_50_64_11]|nr:MAG: hypothetical protein COW59_05320 [Xanthomonadales bacterium CG17_big_fil_post_rev_8_21_14_2_50_64_11]PIX61654.1 MAG: hypothetical protein COZ47_00835 [Xanthomonadales bacterium CG_4_10_14_3_um_filter_64_11]